MLLLDAGDPGPGDAGDNKHLLWRFGDKGGGGGSNDILLWSSGDSGGASSANQFVNLLNELNELVLWIGVFDCSGNLLNELDLDIL